MLDGRLRETGLERSALQERELVVDLADDVPGAEVVDLPAYHGDEFLGERPAAPAGAQTENALRPRVERDVGLLLGRELLQVQPQLLRRLLAGVLRNGLGDLRSGATAAEQTRPARPQVDGGPVTDPAGQEPADDRGHEHGAQIVRQDPVEGQLEQHERRGDARPPQQDGADDARPLVLGARGEAAQLDDAEPEQQTGQEEDAADHGDQRQLGVAAGAGCGWPRAVLDDRLRLGAERLDEGLAAASQHPDLYRPGEGLAEVGAEELLPFPALEGRLVEVVVGLLDRVERAVAVRGGRECVRRARTTARAHEGDLRPGSEAIDRHCRPHRRGYLCGLFPTAAPRTPSELGTTA